MRNKRSGAILVIVVILLVVVASLTAAMTSMTAKSYIQADAARQIMQAQCDAEAGVSFLAANLVEVQIPENIAGPELLALVAGHLAETLDGSPNLDGQTVGFDGQEISIPAIATDSGRSFAATMRMYSPEQLLLTVDGASGPVRRTVSIRLRAVRGNQKILDYAISARGPIDIKGRAAILAVNEPSEANCYSAGRGTSQPLKMSGRASLAGKFDTANGLGQVDLSGTHMVGGKTYHGPDSISAEAVQAEPQRYDPFRFDLRDYDFPEIVPSVFGRFVARDLRADDLSGPARTLVNVRIPANTNPVFSGKTQIQGVLYIEQPNKVKFTGQCDITGVIVTQPALEDPSRDDSSISFTGRVTARGVEDLPDQPEFAALRRLPGTSLLAPGFEVDMAGHLGVVTGAMAAEHFRFVGNVSGQFHGPILSYGQREFAIGGSSELIFDRSRFTDSLPGFGVHSGLVVMPDTYLLP